MSKLLSEVEAITWYFESKTFSQTSVSSVDFQFFWQLLTIHYILIGFPMYLYENKIWHWQRGNVDISDRWSCMQYTGQVIWDKLFNLPKTLLFFLPRKWGWWFLSGRLLTQSKDPNIASGTAYVFKFHKRRHDKDDDKIHHSLVPTFCLERSN